MGVDYILIGADLVPTKSNSRLFIDGNANMLVGKELLKVLNKAKFRIFNLEVPLTDQEKPIIKNGPNLIAATATIKGYKALNINLLTLANNHILDQGETGLKSTIETLNKAGIKHLGAGDCLRSASKPYIFNFAGKRIGVYACVEHEFSVADGNTGGANPYDSLWTFDHVEELRRKTDYVIVLYHGGKEHYRYPSPMLQRVCRRLVDKGADLVICQHSHCIGCEEKYKTGVIVYGQGNFIFDECNNECWETSLLIKLCEDFSVAYLPLKKNENGVRLADEKMGEKILSSFRLRSDKIKEPGFIKKSYTQFADSFTESYLRALSGKKTLMFRILNKLTRGRKLKKNIMSTYGTMEKVRILNYIDCESHRELLSQALSNDYKGTSYEKSSMT